MDSLFKELKVGDINNNKFYFFTNNNSMMAYLSLDSITCNKEIGTENYDISFGNSIDEGILLVHDIIDTSQIGIDFKYSYAIRNMALELDFMNAASFLPVIIINGNYESRQGYIADYDIGSDIAIFISGHFSFSYVKKILFPSSKEMDEFEIILNNVSYPEYLYEINSEIFEGKAIVDIEKCRESINLYITNNEIDILNILKITKLRDRLKGLFQASISLFRTRSSIYEINNDYVIENLFKLNRNMYLDVLKENGYTISEDDFIKTKDITPFKDILKILEEIINESFENNDTNISLFSYDSNNKPEFIVLLSIYKYLINKKDVDLESKSILLYEIQQRVESDLINYSIDEATINQYTTKFKDIQEAFQSLKRITDIIEDPTFKSHVLNALTLFLSHSHKGDFDTLIIETKRFNFNSYESRLARSIFGITYGTAYLEKNCKENPYLNRKIDELVYSMTANENVISEVCDLVTFQNNRLIELNNSLSVEGYPVVVISLVDSETCKKYLKLYLNKDKTDSKSRSKIDTQLKKFIKIPEDYISYKVEIYSEEFNFKDNKVTLKTLKKPIIKEEYNVQDFIENISVNDTKMVKLFNENPEGWKEFIINIKDLYTKK